MHWREIEVGMWIDKVGLVTEVKESPVVAGEPISSHRSGPSGRPADR